MDFMDHKIVGDTAGEICLLMYGTRERLRNNKEEISDHATKSGERVSARAATSPDALVATPGGPGG